MLRFHLVGAWLRQAWIMPVLGVTSCNAISGALDLTITDPDAGRLEWLPDAVEAGAPGTTPPPPPPDALGATEHVLVVAPDGLDFGSTTCGIPPPGRRVEVRNLGPADISFDAAMATSEVFWVAPSTGTVASGSMIELLVSSLGIPQSGPPGRRSDQLVVTTNAPQDVPHVLDVALSASGAIFSISPSGVFDFGNTTSTKYRKFTIRNDGDVAGTISLKVTESVSNSFDVTPTTPAVLAPGQEVERTVSAHPPGSGTPQKTGTVTFSSSSALCGPVPEPIQLKAYHND